MANVRGTTLESPMTSAFRCPDSVYFSLSHGAFAFVPVFALVVSMVVVVVFCVLNCANSHCFTPAINVSC